MRPSTPRTPAAVFSPPRRVLVLNHFALPRSEGGGTRHVDLFGRLAGWTPTIVASDHSYGTQRRIRTSDPRFRLVRVPAHHGKKGSRIGGWVVYAAQAFAVTVTRRHLDAVYGSSPHLLAPLAGLLAARVRRVPFVLEVRDLWPESIVAAGMLREGSAVHRVLSRLERRLARGADAIVVVTPGWEDHFAGLGVPPERLTVVPNGSDVDEYIQVADRQTMRERHGVTAFTTIYAGAHGSANGLDLLLDAAAEVNDVHVLLVGDGPEKPRLERAAHDRGIRNVEFRSPLPKTELPGLLVACDAGVHVLAPLTVLDRGLSPNKLFDYMAAGLPVVSNARTGLRTVVADGECGHVGDTDSLAEGLRRVRDASPEQRAAWGARGRAIIEERYSRAVAAARLETVLDAAVSARRTRGARRTGRLGA